MYGDAQLPKTERNSRAAMRPCSEALKRNVMDRWGDGTDVPRVDEDPVDVASLYLLLVRLLYVVSIFFFVKMSR